MNRFSLSVLRSLVVMLALGALTSCTRKTEGGLLLKVTVDAAVRADCVVIDATSNGARVSRSVVARQAMKADYFVGVARSDFPATLTWQASSYLGRCADETDWKLTSRSAEQTQTFPATGVEQVTLTIGQPDATLDSDRDTWVDAMKGGADCDDTNAQVNPGARQQCGSSVDTNCNGKLYCEDATCANEPACAVRATVLSFASTLDTLRAADCSGLVTVQATANGQPAAVDRDVTVSLAASGTSTTGLELFTDANCTMALPTPSLHLRFGATAVTFAFRTPTPGTLTQTASAPGLGMTSLTTTITDRPVASLSLSPVTLSAQAGECSAAVEVRALDDRMMPTRVGADLALAVGFTPSGTTTVFTDATCQTMGAPSIVTGTSSTRLYLKDTRVTPAGAPIQVEVTSPTLASATPATLAFTVTAGAPDRIEFVSSALGVRNGTCGVVPAEVQLLDTNGNVAVAGAGGVTVALLFTGPTGGSLQFFADGACATAPLSSVQVAAGQSRAAFYVRAGAAGQYQVTASAPSLANQTATLQVGVSMMDPTALFFPASATTITTTAGTCSPVVRLQTKETSAPGALVSPVPTATTITVTPTPAGVQLFSDSACMTAVATRTFVLPAGSSELSVYFRSNTTSSFTLGATATGFSAALPEQPGRVNPGGTSKLVFDPPTIVSAQAGGCTQGLVLRSFDSFNNPTSASGAVTPAATPAVAPTSDGVIFSASASCAAAAATVTMTDGGVTFYASARKAQQYSISATGFAASSSSPVTFTVDAGAPSALVVVTQPQASLAAGGCTSVVVERRDALNNPAPGAAAAFSVAINTTGVLSTHGDFASCMSGTAGPALAFAAGSARATWYVRGRLVGSSTMTASGTGVSSATTASVAVTASGATQLRFATNSPPSTSAVGGCLSATVERLDAEGNLATTPADQPVTLSASGAGSMSGLVLGAGGACGSTAQTMLGLTFTGAASSTTFSYSPRATGALSFAVSGAGLTTANGMTTVGAGAVDHLRFVMPPTTDQAYDGCTVLEVEALDVGGNRVTTAEAISLSTAPAAQGTFFASTTCAPPSGSSVMVPAGGTAQFGFKPTPTVLGMVTAIATPSIGAAGQISTSFNVVAGTESKLLLSGFPTAMTTSDTCVDFTVRRVDSGDHDTGGAMRAVTITASGAASMAPTEAQLFTGTGCMAGSLTTNPATVNIAAAGSSATFSVKVRKAGALTIAAASMPLMAPPSTSTTVTAGALSSLAFTTMPPASLNANGCSPLVTVTGTDANSNPAALGTLTLSMPNGTFFSDSSCTTSIPSLAAGTATSAGFYLRVSTAGPAVTLTVGTAPTVTQNWNIVAAVATAMRWKPGAAPPGTLARFTCSGAFRVQTTDGVAPVATVAARVLSFAPASTTGFRYFTDNTCTTPVSAAFEIAAGSSESPDLYAYSLANGTFSAIATDTTSTGALTATPGASVVVSGGGTAALTITPASSDLLYRQCTAVTIRRTLAAADFTLFTTTVNLTVGGTPPVTSYSLHLASDCSDAGQATLSGLTIGPGSATTIVYLRGHSAEPSGATITNSGSTFRTMTLTATDAAGFFTAATTAAINLHPAVRRGTCTIQNNESTSTTSTTRCMVRPVIPAAAVNRTLFTFQAVAVSSPNTPDSASVSCQLIGNGDELQCDRAGTSQDVNISWQAVTLGSGMQVNHYTGTTDGTTPTGALSVDISSAGLTSPSNAFLLFSHRTAGSTFSFDDQLTAELSSSTAVTLTVPTATWPTASWSLQVVQLSGVTVDRGSASMAAAVATTTASVTAPGAGSGHVFLYSQRSNSPGVAPASETAICKYRVRGELTSDTTLSFFRGAGGAAECSNLPLDGIAWERLVIPNTVATIQSFAGAATSVAINGNTTNSALVTLGATSAVAMDRTWSFLNGQGQGGQSGGETNVNSDDMLGYGQARIGYSTGSGNTRITLSRGGAGGSNNSTFGLFVLSFAP